MDAEKNKKLQQYATILTDQAKEAEQSGKSDEAIKHYLKLVDVFLVLASEAPDHSTWMGYIRQAEVYQTRIKSLVPKDQATQDIITRIPPPPSDRNANQPSVRRIDSSPVGTLPPQGVPSTSIKPTSSISKIFKPFQNNRLESAGIPEDLNASTNLLTPQNPRATIPTAAGPPQPTPAPSSAVATPKPTNAAIDERAPVPHELYDRLVSENRILHERLQSVIKEADDKAAFLESRNRELEDRMAMMISKSDYDQLRTEFENMVPKHEYDRLKSELTNTVPITHYDQLLDRIANMVPREVYMASEKRVLELEDSLRHSVPLAVIDDIANEVSYVSILAEVPPIVDESAEEVKEREKELLEKEQKEGKATE